MNSESVTGFFPGLILGAVVGAAVALPYAYNYSLRYLFLTRALYNANKTSR